MAVIAAQGPPEEFLTLQPRWMPPHNAEARTRAALKLSPWPPWLHEQAVAVIGCESAHNPSAIGDDGLALGLFQIRTDYHPELVRLGLLDPLQNLTAGFIIYLKAGRTWQPWTCQPN